jgi:hypothetical protein
MQQNDDNVRDARSKTNLANEARIKSEENWLDEHGQPSFEYLQSLAADGSSEAIEKLKSIAEDLDVSYDPDTSAEELIGRIRSATRNDPNTTT